MQALLFSEYTSARIEMQLKLSMDDGSSFVLMKSLETRGFIIIVNNLLKLQDDFIYKTGLNLIYVI